LFLRGLIKSVKLEIVYYTIFIPGLLVFKLTDLVLGDRTNVSTFANCVRKRILAISGNSSKQIVITKNKINKDIFPIIPEKTKILRQVNKFLFELEGRKKVVFGH
jgi:hypothetical protein